MEIPDPPDLTNRGVPRALDPDSVPEETDLRRSELETALEEGAWTEAFEQWVDDTDLSAADIAEVASHGLFRSLDVFWDPDGERLRYEVPPPAHVEGGVDAHVVSELSALAELLVETLEDGYLDWAGEGVPEDVWDEEREDEDRIPEV